MCAWRYFRLISISLKFVKYLTRKNCRIMCSTGNYNFFAKLPQSQMNFKPQTAEFTPAKLTMYAVICSLHNIICLEFREISFGQLRNG